MLFQNPDTNTPTAVGWTLKTLPPIVVRLCGTVIGSVLGFCFAVLLQRRGVSAEGRASTRRLVSHSRLVIARVRDFRVRFDAARATNLNAVVAYFGAPDPVITDEELTELQSIGSAAKGLDLPTLDATGPQPRLCGLRRRLTTDCAS